MGRPTSMTSDVLAKLEYAFGIGSSVSEACAHAGICRDTFYQYIEKNNEFSDKISDLRANPLLKARKAVFDDLDNPKTAQWYLERKIPQEFNMPLLTDDARVEMKKAMLDRENNQGLTDAKTTKTMILTLLLSLQEVDDTAYKQIRAVLDKKRNQTNTRL